MATTRTFSLPVLLHKPYEEPRLSTSTVLLRYRCCKGAQPSSRLAAGCAVDAYLPTVLCLAPYSCTIVHRASMQHSKIKGGCPKIKEQVCVSMS